ncbi:hypothetical protein IFR04_014989 [Cadophora malorum]|uniref:Uncharacterized protein n=1 Tax=Cadophora malorum TaxID=108018 RepID=A0A8H7T3W9_9HELO|nr:hypothetical protein IFR04_014989 [Cadophora malorum]
MTDPSRTKWCEVSPDIYSRPLGEPDLYYTTNAKVWERTGQTASSIKVHVGISLHLPLVDDRSEVQLRIEDSLRYAWKQIRFHCPILASSVVLDPETKIWNRVYQVANEMEVIDMSMEQTFTTNCGSRTPEEFLELDPPVPFPALFVFPVAVPESSKLDTVKYNIIFQSGHDVIDGMAAYAFMDNLLSYTSEAFMFEENIPDVTFGSEHKTYLHRFALFLESQRQKSLQILSFRLFGTRETEIARTFCQFMPSKERRYPESLVSQRSHFRQTSPKRSSEFEI